MGNPISILPSVTAIKSSDLIGFSQYEGSNYSSVKITFSNFASSIVSSISAQTVATLITSGNILNTNNANNPVLALASSPSINGLTISGSANANSVSAITFSAGTINSGTTNLYQIFATIGSGGGGTNNLTFIVKTGTTITPPTVDFNGYNVYLFTDSSGSVAVQMPNPSLVTVGAALRFSMIGGNSLSILPYASETFDGQTLTGSTVVLRPFYQVGLTGNTFIPAQQFGIASNGTNWLTTLNF